jgi:hypothetical protein
MKRMINLLGSVVFVTLGPLANAQSTQTAGSEQPRLMERQKEVALALSACPPPVASKAAVYVLEKPGYVKVRDSQNNFTAIVQHAMPNSQEPQCMDAEGKRTFLPRILKVAELRAQGKSPDEIKRLVNDAFAKGIFQPPNRPGVDYMLSTENLVPDNKGGVRPFPPHVMFYAPYLTNADLGAVGPLGPDGDPAGAGLCCGRRHSPSANHCAPGMARGLGLFHRYALEPQVVNRAARAIQASNP